MAVFYAVAGGFGIAVLFGFFHAIGLRLLWNGIVHGKAYAQWAQIVITPTLLFCVYLISAQLKIILENHGCTGDTALLATAIGILTYAVAALYVLIGKAGKGGV